MHIIKISKHIQHLTQLQYLQIYTIKINKIFMRYEKNIFVLLNLIYIAGSKSKSKVNVQKTDTTSTLFY